MLLKMLFLCQMDMRDLGILSDVQFSSIIYLYSKFSHMMYILNSSVRFWWSAFVFLNKNVCNWHVNIYRNNFLQCTLKASSETDSHLRGIFPFKFGRKMLSKDLCMKTTKRFHWWWELMLAVHIYRVWKQRHIYKTRTDLVFVSCFYLLIFWVENKSEDIFLRKSSNERHIMER